MSDTVLVQPADEAMLDRFEAEFLRSDDGFGELLPEPLLPDAEIPTPGSAGGQTRERRKSTKMPTNGRGCCA